MVSTLHMYSKVLGDESKSFCLTFDIIFGLNLAQIFWALDSGSGFRMSLKTRRFRSTLLGVGLRFCLNTCSSQKDGLGTMIHT
jgi:hypothetical protein